MVFLRNVALYLFLVMVFCQSNQLWAQSNIVLTARQISFFSFSFDDTQYFSKPISIIIPSSILVIRGSSRSGVANLVLDDQISCLYEASNADSDATFIFKECAKGDIRRIKDFKKLDKLSIRAGDIAEVKHELTLHVISSSSFFLFAVRATVNYAPANPVTTAPPILPNQPSDLASSTAFLYSGANPVQTGVAANTIDAKRVSVVRGKATDRNNVAVSGAVVTVVDHPELGQTLTRADGAYDMAVNGGGSLTLNFSKSGFAPLLRNIVVPWQSYAPVTDVVLTALDSKVTTIPLNSTQVQVAQANPVTDSSGTRKATLIFPPNTTATMILPNGTRNMTSLNVRATEFTVGPNGPKAMPAELPKSSAYTYAIELSSDEAIAAGANTVQFNQPVYHYTENFLGFPTGTIVPVGYLDKQLGQWVAAPNGKVIKVLNLTGGTAHLDVTGSGSESSPAQLTAMGITTQERQRLASLYAAGASLWRLPIQHFSTYDGNMGAATNAYNATVAGSTALDAKRKNCPQQSTGSIIDIENQVLRERIPIAGTPFTLNYSSERTINRTSAYTLRIQVTPSQVPANVSQIYVTVQVAGRSFAYTFDTTPNRYFDFTWDGKDAYGRQLLSPQNAIIDIGLVMPANYVAPPNVANVFGLTLPGTPTSVPLRDPPQQHLAYSATIGVLDSQNQNLGGWTLDIHHAYDFVTHTLHLGNGISRSTLGTSKNLTTFTGTGQFNNSGDSGSAIYASVADPRGLVAGADGTVYISVAGRVRKVLPQGTIVPFAGGGINAADGIPATQSNLSDPAGLAIDIQGNVYIADLTGNKIWKVDKNNIISTFAGGGTLSDAVSPVPAKQVRLTSPRSITVANDGTMYVGLDDGTIHRIGADGQVLKFSTSVNTPSPQVAVSADGTSLYVASFNLFKCSPSGQCITLVDTAVIPSPISVTVDQAGIPYFATVSGDVYKFSGGIPTQIPLQQILNSIRALAVDANGNVYVAENQSNVVAKISNIFPSFNGAAVSIASSDASLLYDFDSSGRHLSTRDALTNVALYRFNYDANGRLSSISDRDSNVTTILRDTAGNITQLKSPFGVTTSFVTDAASRLISVSDPAGQQYQFSYVGATRLLNTFVTPRGLASTFTYDALNRLATDTNAAGGVQSLTRVETNSTSVNTVAIFHRDPANVTTSYVANYSVSGDQLTTINFPDGSSATSTNLANGRFSSRSPDGGQVVSGVSTPDPRYGSQSAYASSGQYQYPQNGVVDTDSESKSFAYSSSANPDGSFPFIFTQVDTHNGKPITTQYNSALNTVTITSAESHTTVATLNSLGRVATSKYGTLAPVSYSYDSHGNLTGTTQGARSTSYSYNAQGYLSGITNALNQQTTFGFDPAGRVTSQGLPDGRVIGFSYDQGGNLTSVTPPGKPAHTFSFNILDLISSYVAPTAAPTQYQYDLAKKLTKVTRPDGQVISYNYNPTTGKLASVSSPNYGTQSYTYNSSGQVSSVTIPQASGQPQVINFQTTNYLYNGPVKSADTWNGPVVGSVSMTFLDTGIGNARFWFTTAMPGMPLSFIASSVVDRDRDYQVRSLYVPDSQFFNPSAVFTAGFSRDLETGQLVNSHYIAQNYVNYPNSADPVSGITLDEYLAYNSFGELTQINVVNGSTSFFDAALTRDNLGRITHKASLGHNYDYVYDTAGRLTDVKIDNQAVSHYGYDSNSNRTSATIRNVSAIGVYDQQDRLVSYGTKQYTYNANGELSSVLDTANNQTTSYGYDVFGNMVHAGLPNGNQIDYLLDAQGRRIGKRVNGQLAETLLYKNYLKPVAQADGNNQLIAFFIYGDKENVPYLMTKRFNNIFKSYRIISDERGSVRKVVDGVTGAVVQQISYDEFGNVLSDTNPGFQPFGYAGGLYDQDTKLNHFGAREYDAYTGRWLTRDPIMFGGGQPNLYSYSLQDPINFIDNNGENPLFIIGIGGLVGGTASGFTTYLVTHNLSSAVSSFVTGFITGAASTATALVSPTAAGIAAATVTDIILNFAFAPTALPSDAKDYANGILATINGPQGKIEMNSKAKLQSPGGDDVCTMRR